MRRKYGPGTGQVLSDVSRAALKTRQKRLLRVRTVSINQLKGGPRYIQVCSELVLPSSLTNKQTLHVLARGSIG